MKGLQSSIDLIKKAGFSHIKLELEAQLGRSGKSYTDQQPCTTCEGACVVDVIDGYGRKTGKAECSECEGEGATGDRRLYNFGHEDDCQAFIRKQLKPETLRAINFMRFYRDGSVDSELTFTAPMSKPEVLVEVIEAWNTMVKAMGVKQDVKGAGMHVCVLPGSVYPVKKKLDERKLMNFKSEVTKLLPALFLASTSGNFTRGLNFRQPQIGTVKYSAIHTVHDTCLEYRVFETCYERPEAIYEYIGVIARTLEYYIDPNKKVVPLGREFPIYDKHSLKSFMQLPEQVAILKQQIKYMLPEGMTAKEFFEKRDIDLTVTKLREAEKLKLKRVEQAYAERVKSYKKEKEKPLDEYEKDNIEFWKREKPGLDEDWYYARVRQLQPLETKETYLRNNTSKEQPTVVLAV